MGLTGHILEVEFELERIPSPWIWGESEGVPDIDEFIDALGERGRRLAHDRGLDRLPQPRARAWAAASSTAGAGPTPDEAPEPAAAAARAKLALPFELPSFALNPLHHRACSTRLYYWRQQAARSAGIVHPDAFFYPLDAIHHWNRVYGKRGFTQYQCVIPHAAGKSGRAPLHGGGRQREGGASPLCVIKDCGAEGTGLLSFPEARDLDRDRHPGARPAPRADRRAERDRDRPRAGASTWPRTPSPARSTSAHGAAPGRVAGAARNAGIPSGSCGSVLSARLLGRAT